MRPSVSHRARTRARLVCFLVCCALLAPFVSLALPELTRAQVPNIPSLPPLGGTAPGPNLPNLDVIRESALPTIEITSPITPATPPPRAEYCPDCCENCPPAGNEPPEANAGGPYHGMTGNAVQFTGTGSWDPDGTIVSYQWNFGDGRSITHAQLSYAADLHCDSNSRRQQWRYGKRSNSSHNHRSPTTAAN